MIKHSLKITKNGPWVLPVLCTVCMVPVLQYYYAATSVLLYCLLFLLMLTSILRLYKEQGEISSMLWILLALIVVEICSNAFIKENIVQVVKNYAPVIAFSLFIVSIDKKTFVKISSLWSLLLLLIVLIDLLSIVLFPGGLYTTESGIATYDINWVLGYKTGRLPFCFLLLLLVAYRDLVTKHSLSGLFLFSSFAVLVDALLCEGSAALAGVAIAMIVFFCLYKLKSLAIIRILFDYRVILVSVLIVSFLAVYSESSSLVASISSFFDKSTTLTGRVDIWNALVQELSRNMLFGLGSLNGAEYYNITGGYLNAHNLFLGLMVEGGMLQLAITAFMFLLAFSKLHSGSREYAILLSIAVGIFAVGVVSAKMLYDPVFYIVVFIAERFRDEPVFSERTMLSHTFSESICPNHEKGIAGK